MHAHGARVLRCLQVFTDAFILVQMFLLYSPNAKGKPLRSSPVRTPSDTCPSAHNHTPTHMHACPLPKYVSHVPSDMLLWALYGRHGRTWTLRRHRAGMPCAISFTLQRPSVL